MPKNDCVPCWRRPADRPDRGQALELARAVGNDGVDVIAAKLVPDFAIRVVQAWRIG